MTPAAITESCNNEPVVRPLGRKAIWIAALSLLLLVRTPLAPEPKEKVLVLLEIARYDLRAILGEMHASLGSGAPLFDVSPDQRQLAVNFCVPTADSKGESQ